MKPFIEALAIQCFLNEYVYTESSKELVLVKNLANYIKTNHEAFREFLAVAACYVPLHKLDLKKEWIESYSQESESKRLLIKTQILEPEEEEEIQDSIISS